MTSISAGEGGALDAGHVVEVPDALGRHLAEIGAAVPAPAEAEVTAAWPHSRSVPRAERAERPKAGETADKP